MLILLPITTLIKAQYRDVVFDFIHSFEQSQQLALRTSFIQLSYKKTDTNHARCIPKKFRVPLESKRGNKKKPSLNTRVLHSQFLTGQGMTTI